MRPNAIMKNACYSCFFLFSNSMDLCAFLNGMLNEQFLSLKKKTCHIPLQMNLGTFFHCNSHNILRFSFVKNLHVTLWVRDFWCGFQWTTLFFFRSLGTNTNSYIHLWWIKGKENEKQEMVKNDGKSWIEEWFH